MNDHDPLSRLLRTWRLDGARDEDGRGFNNDVWAKIRALEHATSHASRGPVRQAIAEFTGHFRWAIPLAASLIIVMSASVGSGIAVALERTSHTKRMATAYAHSIDPFHKQAKTGEHHHTHP